jgi:AraC-like DNA-binding protein
VAEDDSSLRCVLRQQERPTCGRGRKAADLLAQPAGRRISDIAFGCGFNDLSYFNRCFRRRYGLTPTSARGR